MKIIIEDTIYEDTYIEHIEINLPDNVFSVKTEERDLIWGGVIRRTLDKNVASIKAALTKGKTDGGDD